MSVVKITVEVAVPEGAPERLKGSAAWLEPQRVEVHAILSRPGEDPWYWVNVIGNAPGSTSRARGEYGAELLPGPDGSYWVPADPWLEIPARIMDPIRHALRHISAAVRTSEVAR